LASCLLRCRRSSLRVLGTVGEPINPEAWRWYNKVGGGRRWGEAARAGRQAWAPP
jgi:acyl-coenzyme A synthetase/AMP-(fatty) acid ligase